MKSRKVGLDQRQILVQKLLAADARGRLIDISKLGHIFDGFQKTRLRVLKKKAKLKCKH